MDRIVRWIHVSDWHVRSTPDRDTKDILNALIDDVKQMTSASSEGIRSFSPDFIVHTGDIAFSGKAEEYAAAVPFLQRLMSVTNLPKNRLYVVPGNHDADDDVAVTPESLLKASDERAYTDACREWYESTPRRETLLKRFNNFHAAFSSIVPPEQRSNDTTPYYACRIELNGVTVGIVGLNSALASRKDDEDKNRRMVLGRWQVKDAVNELEAFGNCDIRIALFHHPMSGLTVYDEQQSNTALLTSQIDIVLRGHLHAAKSLLETSPDGSLAIVTAGSSYENRWALNGYLMAEANLSRRTLVVWFRRWETRVSSFVPDTGAYRNIRPNGSYEVPLPVKRVAPSFPPAAPTPTLVLPSRHAVAIPQSGFERFGVFAGHVHLESHRGIAAHIEYGLDLEQALANKYLFWHVDSRRLYHDCLQEPHYTIARDSEAAFRASLKSLVKHLVDRWGTSTYTVVSLGVGSGVKEKWLLEELRSQNDAARISLLLVDINSQMLKWALDHFRLLCDPLFVRVLFCHADFDCLPRIDALLPSNDGPVIFLLLGGMFGNQVTESGFLRTLQRIAPDDSYLLMGVQTLDAIAGDPTLGGYGTEAAFRFVEVTLSKFDPQYNIKKRSIQASPTDAFPSDIAETETITLIADSPKFGPVKLGFSRRYKRQQLANFLAAQQTPIEWDSGLVSRTYQKVLVKLTNNGTGSGDAKKN